MSPTVSTVVRGATLHSRDTLTLDSNPLPPWNQRLLDSSGRLLLQTRGGF